MGSKLLCDEDYVEFLEKNDRGDMVTVKRYCGDDEPANYVSTQSKVHVHYSQTLNFASTGWVINFIGVIEGKHNLRASIKTESPQSLILQVPSLRTGRRSEI